MSGGIRQRLGPAKARLRDSLDDFTDHVFEDTAGTFSRQEVLDHLQDQLIQVGKEQRQISKYRATLESVVTSWDSVFKTLAAADLAAEEARYKQAAEGDEGFIAVLENSEDVLIKLATIEDEIKLHISKLSGGRSTTAAPAAAPLPTAPAAGENQQPGDIVRSTSPALSTASQAVPQVKLPKLQLPTYSGEPEKWKEFIDIFETSVDEQELADVEKFSYLKVCLKGKAAAAIEGYAVTNDNYKDALAVLKRRFGNKDIIIETLYSKLRGIHVSSARVQDLQNGVDAMEKILRQLESWGEVIEQAGTLHLLLEKIPSDVLLELERLRTVKIQVSTTMKKQEENSDSSAPGGSSGQAWSVAMLREYLWDVVSTRERVERISHLEKSKQKARTTDTDSRSGSNKQREKTTTPGDAGQPVSTFSATTGPSQRFSEKKSKVLSCSFCKKGHESKDCTTCPDLESRMQVVSEKRLCFRCLRANHFSNECRAHLGRCKFCSSPRHNSALCKSKFGSKNTATATVSGAQSQTAQSAPSTPSSTNMVQSSQPQVSVNQGAPSCSVPPSWLSLARVPIAHPKLHHRVESRIVLMDSGSHQSFVTDELVDLLKLPVLRRQRLKVNTFGQKEPLVLQSRVVQLSLILPDGKSFDLYANSLPFLTRKMRHEKLEKCDLSFIEWYQKKPIAPSSTRESLAFPLDATTMEYSPDLLLGQDYFWQIHTDGPRQRLPSGLYLIPSILGYLLGGRPLKSEPQATESSSLLSYPLELQVGSVSDEPLSFTEQVEPDWERFWKLEASGIVENPVESDDVLAQKLFDAAITFEGGRYSVPLPLKPGDIELPDNFGLCYGRFRGCVLRLQLEPQLLARCDEIIREQLSQGVVEEAKTQDGPRVHYLAHHAVVTPQRATTKVRLVYDGSARQGRNPSLNDCLLRGPVILPDLVGQLLRFLLARIALISDLEKAFLRVGLNRQDRDLTRFLWLKDASKPELANNILVLRFARVPFGLVCSPFLLGATVRHHLALEGTPLAKQIAENIYVDNVILGVSTVEEAEKAYAESKAIFSRCGMNLREFASNSAEFMAKVPEVDRAKGEVQKVLGMQWNIKDDSLSFSRPKLDETEPLTKRKVSSAVASVFDPLGLAAPLVLLGKLFMQQLWCLDPKVDWDSPLSDELRLEWQKIWTNLQKVSELQVPRNPSLLGMPENPSFQLHCFVDASGKAYACAVYLRMSSAMSITCHLVFAKTRCAPKLHMTVVRLELLGVTCGVRALKFLVKELKRPMEKLQLWTDSQACLHWIRNAKNPGVFVENRLKEIRAVENTTFSFIPTDNNPADLASRGLDLESQGWGIWWTGPQFLCQKEEEWPKHNVPDLSPELLEAIQQEERKHPRLVQLSAVAAPVQDLDSLPAKLLNRSSKLGKLLRITVYLFRFLLLKFFLKLDPAKVQVKKIFNDNPLFKEFKKVGKRQGTPMASEVSVARRFWIKWVQAQALPRLLDSSGNLSSKKNSMVRQLGIRFHGHGILRCYGRLNSNEVLIQAPVLLPSTSRFTELVIWFIHYLHYHASPQYTLAELRKTFWIPKGRAVVKRVLRSCVTCKRFVGGPYKLPPMPDLPDYRITPARPFSTVGLDYMGPLRIKLAGEVSKIWVLLFTCAVVRAVHLEVVFDLSTQSFLNALRRFVSRRGVPSLIISDQAATFKLADQVLRKAWAKMLQSDDVANFSAQRGISWEFIAAYAPWAGGFYERMVGIVKSGLKKAIGRRLLSFDEFSTFLLEFEALVNSRPLTYLYDDPTYRPLRPIDFLAPVVPDHDHVSVGFPPFQEEEEDSDDPEWKPPTRDQASKLVDNWSKTQSALKKLWIRFVDEYLPSLREVHHWDHAQAHNAVPVQPQVDDIVLLHEENQPRNHWKLARILSTRPGRDGQVRDATVRLPQGGESRRPVNRLYPLECGSPTHSQTLSSFFHTVHTAGSGTLLSVVLVVLLSLCSTVSAVSTRCPGGAGNLTPVISQACVNRGEVIYRRPNGKFCFGTAICRKKSEHFDGFGRCAPKCACPAWAEACSHYNGTVPTVEFDPDDALSVDIPAVCSWSPSPGCSANRTVAKVPRVQLYSGRLVFVDHLRFVFQEPEEDSYECMGNGELVTGTDQFCAVHTCSCRSGALLFFPP